MGISELPKRNISESNEKLQGLPLDFLRDEDGLNMCSYQIEAVQAVEKAVIDVTAQYFNSNGDKYR